MILFQCENCGCVENTALASQGFKDIADWFDWKGVEERKGMLLCSACGPLLELDGLPTGYGVWHKMFDRVYLPKGMFKTASNGNLEHIETGEQDYRKYVTA